MLHHLAYLAVSGPGKNSDPAFTAVMLPSAILPAHATQEAFRRITVTQWMEQEGLTGLLHRTVGYSGKTPPAPLAFRAQHTHTYAAALD